CGRASSIARPAAATRKEKSVSSRGVSSLRSHTSRGGCTSRLPPSARSTSAAFRSGKPSRPPAQAKSVRAMRAEVATLYTRPRDARHVLVPVPLAGPTIRAYVLHMAPLPGAAEPDFRALFESSPGLYLVLDP